MIVMKMSLLAKMMVIISLKLNFQINNSSHGSDPHADNNLDDASVTLEGRDFNERFGRVPPAIQQNLSGVPRAILQLADIL
jgi:hypothetical protein